MVTTLEELWPPVQKKKKKSCVTLCVIVFLCFIFSLLQFFEALRGPPLAATSVLNQCKSPGELTFEHRDLNGSTVGADAVAADTHVGARVGQLDVGDEESAYICAVHVGLERRRRSEMSWMEAAVVVQTLTAQRHSAECERSRLKAVINA